MDLNIRHIRHGLRGAALRAAVTGDLERAARLLETGLWSFNLARGARARNQAIEAARAAEEARTQVLKALREARAAWDEVRREGRAAAADVREARRKSRDVERRGRRSRQW
jgi:predicted  nucleic acid-binding Zn-ribbon protein